MKKTSTLLLLLVTSVFAANAQRLLVDDFDYTGLLTDNGWHQTGTNALDPIMTTTGLTYPGFEGSNIGNAAAITGTNQDVAKMFAAVTGEGSTVFMSAMIQVTENAANTGGYFLHLGDSTTNFTSFAGRIYVKTDGTGGVNFGTSNNSTATYGTTSFAVNTTYLVVLKYTISTLGNDELKLWVLTGGVPADEANLGTPEVTNTATNGYTEINAVGLRQTGGIPDVVVDGLRIGKTYNDVMVLPLTLTSLTGSLVENGVSLNWTSANEINVAGFTIERSNDGIKFNAIGNVNATNANRASYSFVDAAPLSGANFYRIVTRDKDGTIKYSTIISITNNQGRVKLGIHPNPVMNNLVISHSKAVKEAAITLYNSSGMQVQTARVQTGAIQSSLPVAALKPGSYVLIYQNGAEKSVTRFVK